MLSVIIPTCNRKELLSTCLDGLAPGVQSVSPDVYEIIVTDDTKDDTAFNLVQQKYAWAKYIKGPGKGPAANRNNGAKHAKSEWLIFIDDDCVADKNLLKEYANGIHNNPACLAFEGAIFPDDEKLLRKDMAECPVNTNGGCFWSANICINTNLFKKIGGFDESFLIAAQEDQDIYLKILQETTVPFLKNCSVVHPVRYRRLNDKIQRIPIEINNWIIFAKKNNSWPKLIANGFKFQIKGFAKTMRTHKNKMMIYHLATLVYLLPGILRYALHRKKKSL